MKCECGGILDVIRIEKYPEHLKKEEQISYTRVCDVECMQCGKVYYSQPYDFGSKFNPVRDLKDQ
jgi:hypothetical protein